MTSRDSTTKKFAMRRVMLFGLSVLAICLFATTGARAQPLPTDDLALVDFGIPTVNTGNINTATRFNIGDLTVLPSLTSFGQVTINKNIPNSISFGNSVFGNFTSTFITQSPTAAGFADLSVLGTWTPGTLPGVTGGPFLASLRIAFTQTPPVNGVITDTASFSTPPSRSVIPEPSTIVMFLTGAITMYRLRRRRYRLATP